jgi:hypothetical protein
MSDLPTFNIRAASRNPLGIIAVFVGIVYALVAIFLFDQNVETLGNIERFFVLLFLLLFPAGAGIGFIWLIITHQDKLYGPSDFKSDEGFLAETGHLPPEKLGERLQDDLEEVKGQADSRDGLAKSDAVLIAKGLISEVLVFMELHRELHGCMERQVRVHFGASFLDVDWVIHTRQYRYMVEVKLVQESGDFAAFVQNLTSVISEIVPPSRYKFILALVIDKGTPESSTAIQRLKKELNGSNGSVDVRFFVLDKLLSKYDLALLKGSMAPKYAHQ